MYKVKLYLTNGYEEIVSFEDEIQAYYFFKEKYIETYGRRVSLIKLYDGYRLIAERYIQCT